MRTYIKNTITRIYCNVILRLPKINRNKALFIITDTHSDNCMSLIEYLLDINEGVDICVLSDEAVYEKYKKIYKGKNIRVVSAGHNFIKSNYELLTSRYVFFMHRRPFSLIKKRKDQTVVNLWHGSGYKDVANNEGAWRNGIDFDYVLVPGPVFVETKSRFFSCDKRRVLPLGYPRYDDFKKKSPVSTSFVNSLKKTKDTKIIIWLPTYRKKNDSFADSGEANIKYEYDIPLLKSEDELNMVNKACAEKNVVILVKRHPFQKPYSCEKNHYSNIKFMNNSDLQKADVPLYGLLRETDALISDYSSVAIDYMLLDKPMAFALDDFEKYKKARGFVFEDPIKYMPGDHLYEVSDLIEFVINIGNGKDIHKNERLEILPEVHNRCDNYCRRIWETINLL